MSLSLKLANCPIKVLLINRKLSQLLQASKEVPEARNHHFPK